MPSTVALTQNYFRRSVESALDIGVHSVIFETTATKINNFDGAL